MGQKTLCTRNTKLISLHLVQKYKQHTKRQNREKGLEERSAKLKAEMAPIRSWE